MRRAALLLLLVLPLLAACSGSVTHNSTSSAPKSQAGGAVAAPAKAQQPDLPRQVVRTARISVTVDDTTKAAESAVALAARLGGRVDSDERTAAGHGSATLVLRVPPESVERALTALAQLGKETARSASDTDVTADSVDLASRVATQRRSVERVRALLARAESLADITRIEGELTTREAALESLQNRQKALAGQVDLASVTAVLSGSRAQPAGPVQHAGFTDGVSGGWTALTATARVLAVVAGALLPWAWIVVLAIALRLAWRRRRALPAATGDGV